MTEGMQMPVHCKKVPRSPDLPLQLPAKTSRALYQRLMVLAFGIDLIVITLALLGSHSLRFGPFAGLGVPDLESLSLRDYAGHFVLGTALMLGILFNFRCYSRETLLSYPATVRAILHSSCLWFFAFLTITLILKFDPPISRFFTALGVCAIFIGLLISRGIQWTFISSKKISSGLRQRALVVGWSQEFAESVEPFRTAPERYFDIVGVIEPPNGTFGHSVPDAMPVMGSFSSIPTLLQMKVCQMVIVADNTLDSEHLVKVASICEKEMIEFKLVPTCFRVLLSGLHLESVGGMPILGISRLPLHSTLNTYIKRSIDLAGSLLGLLASLPIIALFGCLIYRESRGSIFYKQRRLGANGRSFDMIKLRSMKPSAESDGNVGWTVKNDPRCLKVGAFIRRWNIDELPQFWNVLRGEMSLVGPRPERPELIAEFKEHIPHYNARHNIKPGITGWAQVNGLRGDTDLSKRIRFDLHYIENWNISFDFQIMLLTFFRREGAC